MRIQVGRLKIVSTFNGPKTRRPIVNWWKLKLSIGWESLGFRAWKKKLKESKGKEHVKQN